MQLELRYHPAAEHPIKAGLYAAFIGAMAALMPAMLNSTFASAVLLALMIYNVTPYFVATNYRIDDEGLHYQRLGKQRHYLWQDFRSYSRDKNGIILWAKDFVPDEKMDSRQRWQAMRRSAFLPMSPALMEQSEPLLQSKLVQLEVKANAH